VQHLPLAQLLSWACPGPRRTARHVVHRRPLSGCPAGRDPAPRDAGYRYL